MRLILQSVIDNKETLFIPCEDENDLNSKRVSFMNLRRKLPQNLRDRISVKVYREKEKKFVQLSWIEPPVIYKKGDDGQLYATEVRVLSDAERLRKLMTADGCSEEEIAESLEVLKKVKENEDK